MVRDTPPSQDASTHQIWNSYLKDYRRYAPDTKWDRRTDGWTFYYYKNLIRGQGHSDAKKVCDTPPSQDASTHQIWNSYLKEYMRYAPDTKLTDGRTVPKFLWGHKNIFERKIVNIFLLISFNIMFWWKESSHWDGSFEYSQHMF